MTTMTAFTPKERAGFKAAFDAMDADNDGHLDVDEMKKAMKRLGVDTSKLKEVLSEVDKNNDGNITFEEFTKAMRQAKKGNGSAFTNMVNKQKDLIAISTTSGGVRSYTQEEVAAYATHINYCLGDDKHLKYLMPIDPTGTDLFTKVQDGCLIAKFINLIEPNTILWRSFNYKKNGGLNRYEIGENQTENIGAAKSIGMQIHNIGAADLRDSNKNYILVLGFLWQAVKKQLMMKINLKHHPELIALLNGNEKFEDLLDLPPEELLRRWVNYHMAKQNYPTRIVNFTSDIKDAKVYTVLLKSIGEAEGCNMDPLKWDNDKKRANQVITNAQKIGCKPMLTGNDIVSGNDKLNLAFVAQLFNTRPGLKEVDQEEQKELAALLDDDENDSREERAFRMWMNSLGMTKYVNNLYDAVRSGLVFLKVIDKIEPGLVNWKKAERNPNSLFKKNINNSYAIELGKKMKLSLVNIGGSNITNRHKKLILAFTWQLMRYHLLKFLASLNKDGKAITDNDIISFCNDSIMTAKLDKKPQIKSFSDETISNGLYFIYLVASLDPKIVDWTLVTDGESDEDKVLNARYAISLARKFGALIFLLPEDIVDVNKKMCMTFCAAVMYVSKGGNGKLCNGK